MIPAGPDHRASGLALPTSPSRRAVGSPSGAASPPARQLAGAGFVLLFPGFLLYHYGVSAGWWGTLLGGLFGAGSTLVALASIASLHRRPGAEQRLTTVHLMFLGCIAYMVTWSLSQWPGIGSDALMQPIMVEAFATVVIWVALLFVGSQFPTDTRTVTRINAVGVGIVLLGFGHAFYVGGFPAGPFLAFVSADDVGSATYQGIGRSLLAIAIVAALAVQPFSAGALVTLLGAATLMLSLGSRSHFFVLGLSVGIHLLVLVAGRATRKIGIAGLVLAGVIIAAGSSFFLETRAAEVVDLATSASWQERSVANERALQIIAESPLVGSFGYHAWDSAGYAHNALSAWTQYGIGGFALYAFTMTVAAIVALVGFARTRGTDPAWHLALHFNLISIVLAIASEPIMSSVFPALAWGFTIRALRSHRRSRPAAVGG